MDIGMRGKKTINGIESSFVRYFFYNKFPYNNVINNGCPLHISSSDNNDNN